MQSSTSKTIDSMHALYDKVDHNEKSMDSFLEYCPVQIMISGIYLLDITFLTLFLPSF